MTSFH